MKHLLTTLTLLMCLTTFAQPFITIGLSNKGFTPQLGIHSNGVIFTLATKLPLTHTDVPVIHSFTIGKEFLLSHADEDNYTIGLHAGPALYRVKDFTKYDADPTGLTPIVQVSRFKMMFSVELGKDSYMGRWFIYANYCGAPFFGAGVKAFFYR